MVGRFVLGLAIVLESTDFKKIITGQLYFFQLTNYFFFMIWQSVWCRATVCRLSADLLADFICKGPRTILMKD